MADQILKSFTLIPYIHCYSTRIKLPSLPLRILDSFLLDVVCIRRVPIWVTEVGKMVVLNFKRERHRDALGQIMGHPSL